MLPPLAFMPTCAVRKEREASVARAAEHAVVYAPLCKHACTCVRNGDLLDVCADCSAFHETSRVNLACRVCVMHDGTV